MCWVRFWLFNAQLDSMRLPFAVTDGLCSFYVWYELFFLCLVDVEMLGSFKEFWILGFVLFVISELGSENLVNLD